LTAADLYETGETAGPNGDVKRLTIVISGTGTGTIHVETAGYDADRVVDRSSGTLVYLGGDAATATRLTLVSSCPSVASRDMGFTAQAGQLILFSNGGGEKTRLTLARQ